MLVFATMLAAFSSCNKDKDNPGTPAVLRIAEYKNGEDFARFFYNADGSVKKLTLKTDINTDGDAVDYTVSHTNDNKIASLTTAAGEKIEPVYENGVMKRADIFQGVTRTGYTNYHYEAGLMKKATIYFGQDTDFEPVLEFNFKYNAAGNMTETVVMIANGEPGTLVRSGHVEYEYDQKTNPLYIHRDLLALFWQGVSKNNITIENHFDSELQAEDKYAYTYNYKANGFPENAVVKQGLPGNPIITTNINFTYQ